MRYADTKGYAYSRDDVRGKALANAYSQAMGEVFTREMKPLEVEVIVAEVGDDTLAGHEKNALYRVKFDGFISDHSGFCVIGGSVDDVQGVLQERVRGRHVPRGEPSSLGARPSTRGTGESTPPRIRRPRSLHPRSRADRPQVSAPSADEVQGMLDA